jgi:hypothetical protein
MHFSESIDWAQPWLADWCPVGPRLADAARMAAAQGVSLAEAINQFLLRKHDGTGPVVRFVPQAVLPEGCAYESFIDDTRQVPTREGLHDFFNALCWVHFPVSKRGLNLLQAQAIAAAGSVQSPRGPLRDALTVFDENAALLQAPEALWSALRERRWHDLFVTHRAQWAHARLVLFGHALLEKLVQPYKSITAHVLDLPVPMQLQRADWDAWLHTQLTPERLVRKPFVPLPVLGTPGWWVANQDPGFYADATVFRPRREAIPALT